jgi:hypothetical protein
MGGRGTGDRRRLWCGEKGGFKEAFAAEIVEEIEALVGPGAVDGLDFEAIEIAARRETLALAARAIAQRLNADHSDHVGGTLSCVACQRPARYAGRHDKTFKTALSEMTLGRAYYHCDACESGFYPRDHALGFAHTSLSPAVTRMIGTVGARVSFEEGSELLRELAAIQVDSKQVERTAEALGAEIAAYEREHVEPDSDAPLPSTLYLGMDGTGLPMRADEIKDRPGKQPDGTSKTREAKLVIVWSAEGRDEQGTPVRDAGSISYSAAIESAATRDTDSAMAPFAQRVAREAARRRFDQAQRRAVLGDGAPWIWNIADEQFPDAIQIVDRYHAKQNLCAVAKAIYGATSDLGKAWASQRHDELDAGNLRAVVAALALHANTSTEARKCIGYVSTNRQRMRYPHFQAQGLCTSTGVVEAGCKVALGTRLKCSGMHWTVAGANAIAALRCCKLSGRFEDFWEQRLQTRGAP